MSRFLMALLSTGIVSILIMIAEVWLYEVMTAEWVGACNVPQMPDLPSVLAVWAAMMAALIATGHLL
jgi:hypothetical protein